MVRSSLASNDRLNPGDEVHGAGLALAYQGDGNFVLYRQGQPLWASNTAGRAAGFVAMQGDGNLVAYDAAGVPYWATMTQATNPRLELARDGIRLTGQAEVWRVAVEPGPAPTHPDPLVGQVRLVDGAFGDDTGPRNISSFHAGNWLGHAMIHGPASIEAEVDKIAAAGYHVARCWFQLHTRPGGWWERWTTPRWNPADDPIRFAEACNVFTSRGIRLHCAGGGIKDMTDAEEGAAFRTLRETIRQIGPESFALVEGCNEIRDTGDEDDIDPRELERLVRIACGDYWGLVLAALSAYTGTEDRETLRTYTPPWMGFYYQHDYRAGRAHDKIRHLFSGAYEGTPLRRNCWHGEPFGVLGKSGLVSAMDNGHELDAHTMSLAAAMAAMTRGVWTYMSGPGVIFGVEPIDELPGFTETPAILRALPQRVGTYTTLGHSGDRWASQRIHAVRADAPEVRAEYALGAGGEFVEILYGPPEQRHDLPLVKQPREAEVLTTGPWGTVTAGHL